MATFDNIKFGDGLTVTNEGSGVIRVDGGALAPGRIAKRVLATAGPGATPTVNTDSYDVVHLTALAAAITRMTTNLTGTPVDGDTLRVSFTDNGTARAIAWGASFEASTVALPDHDRRVDPPGRGVVLEHRNRSGVAWRRLMANAAFSSAGTKVNKLSTAAPDSITVAPPATHAAGDLLLITCCHGRTSRRPPT